MSFVNLHCHSHYSLLDGFGSPQDIVRRAKSLGYPGAAITDHGVTYGLIELYNAASEAGIKPVLGCEIYIAPRTRFDKESKLDTQPYHLTVLAANNEGYENLLTLTTKAHLEGFYYKPRVDYGLLKTYSAGLIILSGCLAAHLPRLILAGDEEGVDSLVQWYLEVFGKERFFLEMQDHPLIENQMLVNERLKELARKYDLRLVVTNDSHYPCPEDTDVHDVLLCIQTGTTVHDQNRMKYTGDFSLRPVEELRKAFLDCPQALEQSLAIVEACDVQFEFDKNLIPRFITPQGEAPDVFLHELCVQGLKERFSDKDAPEEYRTRLEYELAVVRDMGFETYFLIVWDFVKYAKDHGIMVGPGRGSAAGSIIAWTLKITDLDPIVNGLFFERFLNPERVSMPDIDIDFADHRRDEVLNYVIEKYGRDNVAQIITFGTMAPRAAVRDAGRALGIPYGDVDTIAKTIPPPVLGKNAPLLESIQHDKDLRRLYDTDPQARQVLEYASRLEGTVRHCGTHACAVVISEEPLTTYTALQHGSSGNGEIVTQYSAKPLEQLGLLKMDFLGLKNLTVIENAQESVHRRHDETFDIEKIAMDDSLTFELFQRGDTMGVFQFESPGMRRYLKELRPTRFEDIVAMGALYRPGPMEWIPTYIKGKHNPEKVSYLHDSLKPILESTYGVAVYQEQILQIARDFAGFSLGEADILRKAVGKKSPSLLKEQREKFVAGAVLKGQKKTFAEEVFVDVIEPFAGYGFNKAHAVCYGLIAYRTAYLKAHYPVEFMNALLCSDAGNMDRVVLEIKESNEMGITVLPPSLNESFANFTVVDEGAIRFGLSSIKGIGSGPIGEIIAVRTQGGPFVSLADFAQRVPSKLLNKKLIQALAYSGAFDEFAERAQIAENYEVIAKFGKSSQELASNGQTSIFGALDTPSAAALELSLDPVPAATSLQRLKWEKEFLGLYVSGHPLRGLSKHIARKAILIGTLTSKRLSKPLTIVGLVSDFRKMSTKAGAYMASFVIEDPSGRVRAILFPQAYQKFGASISDDALIVASGRIDNKRGVYQLMCDAVKVLSIDTMIANAKESGLFDPEESFGIDIRFLDDRLADSEDVPETAEAEAEVEIEDNAPFTITLPSDISPDTMGTLKDVLLRYPGSLPVEICFHQSTQRIRLPFGIELKDPLREELKGILSSLSAN